MIISEETHVEHYGVKGMKWGQRRAQKRETRADNKWARNQLSGKNMAMIINKTAERGDVEITRINSKSQYKDADFTKDSPLRRQYYNEHAQAYQKVLNQVVKESDPKSPSGRFRLDAVMEKGMVFPTFYIRENKVNHADEDIDQIEVEVEFDEKGHILSFGWPDVLAQSELFDEDGLFHFGVKGMKWGVRKARYQKNRQLNKETKTKEKAQAAKEFDEVRKKLRPKSDNKVYDTSTKEGRKKYRDARAADIDRARERVRTGAAKADLKEAKAEYKRRKEEIGSRAARNILREKRGLIYADMARAREIRDGKELALSILDTFADTLNTYNRNNLTNYANTRSGRR